jgi:hypothetical protein
MLIDFTIGAALAISGMLALLIFGTEIIQLNVEARQYWHAQAALADISAHWQWAASPELSTGNLCSDPTFSSTWCGAMAGQLSDALPNWCANVVVAAPPEVTLSWGAEGCDTASALSISRQL